MTHIIAVIKCAWSFMPQTFASGNHMNYLLFYVLLIKATNGNENTTPYSVSLHNGTPLRLLLPPRRVFPRHLVLQTKFLIHPLLRQHVVRNGRLGRIVAL